MSIVDGVLARHGLKWELNPCRVVIVSHPDIVVQSGPGFDLREIVLRGARERALATEYKRKQRAAA